MNRLRSVQVLLIFFLLIIVFNGSCQTSCQIKGSWILKKGRFFKNYEFAAPYGFNKVTILSDSLMLASGFFYKTEDLVENYPVGRYPFVYYGNKEKITMRGDSIYIYSNPYKTWNSFKIKCDVNELLLIGKNDSLYLVKSKPVSNKSYKIRYIRAYSYGSEILNINYKVTYSNDDKLEFQEFNKKTNSFNSTVIELKHGAFKSICDGFNGVDVLNLKDLYPAEVSDFMIVELEIGLENGGIIKATLQNDDYPDELRLALIPVLYGHQRFIYGKLPAVK